MEIHDASGALAFDIRKQRYTFTSRQREILMRHFNNGMTNQSQAYHEKIMACAREADADFDIVRNWIGNVRRKMRIDATKLQGPSIGNVLMGDGPGSEPKFPRLEDIQNLFGGPPMSKPMQGGGPMIRPPVGFSQPLSHPPQLSIPTMNLQTQLNNHPHIGNQQHLANQSQLVLTDPNLGHVGSNFGSKPQAMQIPKVVSDASKERNNSLSPPAVMQSSAAASTSTAPTATAVPPTGGSQSLQQTIFFSDEKELRENEIRRIMANVQQSVQFLEQLGCDCIVASHYDSKTFVSGTEKGVNYFAEMQEVKPMSEHMKRGGGFNPAVSPSGTNTSTAQEDAAEQNNEHGSKRGGSSGGERNTQKQTENGQQGASNHGNKRRKSSPEEEEEGDDGEGDDDDFLINKKDDNPIHAGQEVFIVDKNHYVIGIGSILPTPHHRVSLKNALAPEDFFD